jgi:dTDP-4-dehydrorhamnose 3,5-epimerase
MGRFDFIDSPLLGAKIVQRKKIEDSRGFLSRFFCADEFHGIGLKSDISQINHTLTRHKGALRGLHFQYSPHAETKIVSCLNGEVFDVAVDLRKDSPTFLQWHGVILSKENQRSFFIPKGFAHGFQTLTEDCELIYLHTAQYVKDAEGALNALDSKLNIKWPLPISDLSERDSNHPYIDQNYQGIAL